MLPHSRQERVSGRPRMRYCSIELTPSSRTEIERPALIDEPRQFDVLVFRTTHSHCATEFQFFVHLPSGIECKPKHLTVVSRERIAQLGAIANRDPVGLIVLH